ENIVGRVIEDPAVRLSDIAMITPEERDELLYGFNDTAVDYPKESTLVSLFEEQVRRTPDAIALEHNDISITYKELNERTNQLSRYLRLKGFEEGSVIGLMIERSIEQIVGIIGILKAGNGYLPLDSSLPKKRIDYMLLDSNTTALIVDKENILYPDLVEVINIKSDKINKRGKNNLGLSIPSNSLVYVIYTSGSTGTPKGVMVNHRSIVNLVYSQQVLFGINETDRILQFSTIVFDASVEQLWLALTNGLPLILADKAIMLDRSLFNDCLLTHKVTHLHATPSFLEVIFLDKPNFIRRVVSGGEECTSDLIERFNSSYDFYNEYGPTETTVTSIVCRIDELSQGNRIPIGKPISNTQVYILDSFRTLLPKGTIGELYIGGDGLSMGYLNNEKLTNEKFVPNPYRDGEFMFRTGDLVRWLHDGNMQFLGRIDNQVKLRGYRIELGEIENYLLSHVGVEDSVVSVIEEQGDNYLVGYYVSKEELSSSDLRRHLLLHLPNYMIPSYYIHLNNLPLTSNGKVDRKALPDPVFTASVDYVAPSNNIEEQLVGIWSDVLKLDRGSIGVTQGFFALGGNSLSAMVLVNKINKEFEVLLPLREIFSHQDIRSLGQYLSGSERSLYRSIPVAPEKGHYAL
ncbi:non-ribosomal peptide synthetase, partial [Maribacter sp. 2307UL18-2]|uniref:non-ribosomal peptide synthetase n=1 Tax=Maribacter sp. 2307UL18-2 TaxID=3386274 RepID=UPI0039BD9119